MKRLAFKLVVMVSIFCCVSNLTAQKKQPNYKVDSSKIIHRKSSIPCVKPTDKHVMVGLPLAYYNFNTQVHATFNYLDSNNKTTAITVYDFYIDDSSYYAALYESYRQAGKVMSSLRIEELKDSLEFKVDFKDTSRTLQFINRKKCSGTNSKFREIIEHRARFYSATGQSQNIQGYLCNEYVWNNGQTLNTIWVTAVEDAFLTKLRQDLLYALYYEPVTFSKGIVMLSESVNLQTKNKQRFEIINIQKNFPVRFITAGNKLKSGF